MQRAAIYTSQKKVEIAIRAAPKRSAAQIKQIERVTKKILPKDLEPLYEISGNQKIIDLKKKEETKFDHVFDENTDTATIFERWVQPKIGLLKEGTNINLMVYGHSGSGKSYTMLGEKNSRGLIEISLRRVRDEYDQNVPIKVIFFELYQSKDEHDLFGKFKNIEQRTEKYLELDLDEAINHWKAALKMRVQTSGTTNNLKSSRSHVIMIVIIPYSNSTVSLTMVDLIGAKDQADLIDSTQKQEQKASKLNLMAFRHYFEQFGTKTPLHDHLMTALQESLTPDSVNLLLFTFRSESKKTEATLALARDCGKITKRVVKRPKETGHQQCTNCEIWKAKYEESAQKPQRDSNAIVKKCLDVWMSKAAKNTPAQLDIEEDESEEEEEEGQQEEEEEVEEDGEGSEVEEEDEAEGDVELLRQELKSLQEENNSLQEENNSLREDKEKMRKEMAELRRQLAGFQAAGAQSEQNEMRRALKKNADKFREEDADPQAKTKIKLLEVALIKHKEKWGENPKVLKELSDGKFKKRRAFQYEIKYIDGNLKVVTNGIDYSFAQLDGRNSDYYYGNKAENHMALKFTLINDYGNTKTALLLVDEGVIVWST